MRRDRRAVITALATVLTLLLAEAAEAQQSQDTVSPLLSSATVAHLQLSDDDIARPTDLPEVGKWMYDATGAPAHWLGEIYEGKHLREPVNLIILDKSAASAQEAVARLLQAATTAGYPSRFGHSSGYQAYIGGEVFGQIEKGKEHAFSDDPFELSNDHGRIFGPYPFAGGYLFVGAYSREAVDPLADPGHRYASFNEARDRFSQSLNAKTAFKLTAFVALNNALLTDPKVTTGDHDGVAALLEAD